MDQSSGSIIYGNKVLQHWSLSVIVMQNFSLLFLNLARLNLLFVLTLARSVLLLFFEVVMVSGTIFSWTFLRSGSCLSGEASVPISSSCWCWLSFRPTNCCLFPDWTLPVFNLTMTVWLFRSEFVTSSMDSDMFELLLSLFVIKLKGQL